jgi:L-aspartate oxidase
VVHAGGDATGAEVHRTLAAVPPSVTRLRGAAVALASGRAGRRVTGALVTTEQGDVVVHARATVLATGGLGHAYARTTNPSGVDGSGLALALAAGATLTDVEFVQFHPTALLAEDRTGRLPLVSEAVRGEGALLLDHDHRRFMVGRHPLAELAPRDVVAREITRAAGDEGHVWLDARRVEDLAGHFPTFVASCAAVGLDPATDLVPVTPAEHYLCGGVTTDRWGASSVPGLYAVGEVAATGVHGANRLASNSLLEGLVFGRRLADRLLLDLPDAVPTELVPDVPAVAGPDERQLVRDLLARHVAVERDAEGLALADAALRTLPRTDPLVRAALAVVTAATARTESRGTHHRRDFPVTEAHWARHVGVRLGPDGLPETELTGWESAA